MRVRGLVSFLLVFSLLMPPCLAVHLDPDQYRLLDEIFNTSVNYFLSPGPVTSYGLPLTAYKHSDRARFGYSNPTEWGYTLQAWIAAVERGLVTKSDAVNRINNALGTMESLQNNPAQNYNGLFYPYYKVTNYQGIDIFPYHDLNRNIPSIDNGLLYMSLLITEGWAKGEGYPIIESRAKAIKDTMNFRPFLFTSGGKTYMAHTINTDTGTLSDSKWDVYADEGGLMSMIAYVSDSVNFPEFKQLTNSQMRGQAKWNGYTVKEAAWFNAMFTWAARSISGVKISGTPYSLDSFVPTTKAHLAYGNWLGIDYPAFSDAMSQLSGGQGLVGRYTPPNLAGTVPSTPPSHVMPHALFCPLNILQDLDNATLQALINRIMLLKEDNQGYYHTFLYPFGFEVTAGPYTNTSYSGPDDGRPVFETLSQAYIVLSLFNALQTEEGKGTFHSLAEYVAGYPEKMDDAFNFLYYKPGTCRDLEIKTLINSTVRSIAIGDVNDDSIKEIVYGDDEKIYIYDPIDRAIIWEYPAIYPSTINIADIDDDGVNEIISAGGEIFVLDAKNKIREWSTENIVRGHGYFDIMIENIDNDITDEIIAVEAWWKGPPYGTGGIVYIIDGVTKDVRSAYISNWSESHLARPIYVGDIDNDGVKEIGVSADANSNIYIIGSDTFETKWKSPSFGWINAGSKIYDIDNDRMMEIIGVNGDGAVYVWNLTEEEWNYTDYLWCELVGINDLDNDGYTEIIIEDIGYGESTLGFSILDPKIKSQKKYLSDAILREINDINDIDKDSISEIIGVDNGYFLIIDGKTWKTEWASAEWALNFIKSIGDIDSDGITEIIYQDYEGYMHIINGADKEEKIKSSKQFPNIAKGDIFIGDLDNDDSNEFIIQTSEQIIIFNITSQAVDGDVNSDGIVNIFDLAAVGLCYGKSAAGSCQSADVNSDGIINIFDLATVGLNYGRSC